MRNNVDTSVDRRSHWSSNFHASKFVEVSQTASSEMPSGFVSVQVQIFPLTSAAQGPNIPFRPSSFSISAACLAGGR